MKPYYFVTLSKDGSLYIPKLTTSYLGILGWSCVAIEFKGKYILMRFYKYSIDAKMGDISLTEKSGLGAMRGFCRRLTEAIKEDFGDANRLNLKFNHFSRFNAECVEISIERLSKVVENLAQNEEMLSSVELAHVELAHPRSTESKPSEKKINNINIDVPITRPLPEGLPDWLSGPLSRGWHVFVTCKVSGKNTIKGWAVGACIKPQTNKPLVIVMDTEGSLFFCDLVIKKLKQPAECFKIAFKIAVDRKIGLTLPQISAIINGGIPPEGHGLPNEMFE